MGRVEAGSGERNTNTYIEEHDVSVREVGLKGGAMVEEISSVGGDRAALVGRAVGRRRRLPPQHNMCNTRHNIRATTLDKTHALRPPNAWLFLICSNCIRIKRSKRIYLPPFSYLSHLTIGNLPSESR